VDRGQSRAFLGAICIPSRFETGLFWAKVIQFCQRNDHGRKPSHVELYVEVLWGSQHAIIKYTLASGANDSLQLVTKVIRLRAGLGTGEAQAIFAVHHDVLPATFEF
jgi:hypothetical protein